MNDEALATLAESIRQHGVIQPILVTETIDGYQLVAGERRVRAARIAGLERIPAIVRQLADRQQLELALVENLQREDLDPIEAARAYRQLIDEFAFSQEDLAARVGRARSTVANTLRLLELHQAVQDAVGDAPITRRPCARARRPAGRGPGPRRGHGRRRGPVGPPDRGAGAPHPRAARIARPAAGAPQPADPDVERVEEDLRRSLGTKVRLTRTRRGGRIVIEYYGDEELARIYQRLIGGNA